MKKSMYSLMLMDDLVAKLDKVAYENNTNRSNMANQILAQYLSYVTPEMRVKEIIDTVTNIMDNINNFQIQNQPTAQGINIKSSLQYKYRPTIRYSVEFNKTRSKKIGVLKITFRTQSPQLLSTLDDFFKVWISVEEKHLGVRFPKHELTYLIGEGKLIRTFMCYDQNLPNSNILGETIANYIRTFDAAIKTYLEQLDPFEIEAYYIAYLEKNKKFI